MTPIGGYWAAGAYPQACELGCTFGWLSAHGLTDDAWSRWIVDTDGWVASGLDAVLQIHITSEALLTNLDGAWERWIAETRERAEPYAGRLIGIQYDEELVSRLLANAGRLPADTWPRLSRETPGLHLLPYINAALADRTRELRRIFGPLMRPLGQAEFPMYPLTPFEGQDWWGLDCYLGDGFLTAEKIRAVYADVATQGLRLMPMFPAFHESGRRRTNPLDVLACYAPLFAQYRRQIGALGIFALNTQRLGGAIYGALDLGEPYPSIIHTLAQVLR